MKKYVRYDHKEAYFSNDHRQGRVYASTTSMFSKGYINVEYYEGACLEGKEYGIENNTWETVLGIAKRLAQDAGQTCGK
jgi:hypothetical protein